jgi:hypothetical protein
VYLLLPCSGCCLARALKVWEGESKRQGLSGVGQGLDTTRGRGCIVVRLIKGTWHLSEAGSVCA